MCGWGVGGGECVGGVWEVGSGWVGVCGWGVMWVGCDVCGECVGGV